MTQEPLPPGDRRATPRGPFGKFVGFVERTWLLVTGIVGLSGVFFTLVIVPLRAATASANAVRPIADSLGKQVMGLTEQVDAVTDIWPLIRLQGLKTCREATPAEIETAGAEDQCSSIKKDLSPRRRHP